MTITRQHEDTLINEIKKYIDVAASDIHPSVEHFQLECRAAHFARTNFFADRVAEELQAGRTFVYEALLKSPYINKQVQQHIDKLSRKVRVV